MGWGKNSYEQSANQSTNYNYADYAFYANLLAFQCRVSSSFALGIVVGDVSYWIRNCNIGADINNGHYDVNQFIVNLNSGGIYAHFYF